MEPKAAKYRDCGGDHDDADGVSKRGYDSLLPTTRALHMAPRAQLGKQQATPGLDGLDVYTSSIYSTHCQCITFSSPHLPKTTADGILCTTSPTNPSRVHPSSCHHTLLYLRPLAQGHRPPAPPTDASASLFSMQPEYRRFHIGQLRLYFLQAPLMIPTPT